ncbi:MAG: metallophosphoesterase [Tissierellia bacterium]|nr:metallophosphoesterase [Tissierellia bacterium]
MKFIFFTDVHVKGTNPKSRIDNYFETVKAKLIEIKNYANSNKYDFIVFGGDLFDRPDSSISIASDIANILMDFNMPIYTIIGNHDIFGYNLSTINRSIMGFLINIGILKLIPHDGIYIENGLKICLIARHFKYDLDSDPNNYIIRKSDYENSDYYIEIVHGFLIDKPFIKDVPHILIDNILDTEADIILAGHYHLGFPTLNHEGKYFVNPGSLLRISSSLNEINRKPKFNSITLTKDDIIIEDIYLNSAKSGSQVLDRSHIEKAKVFNQRLNKFIELIDSSKHHSNFSIETIMEKIAQDSEFDSNVKREALERIEEARSKNKYD